MKAHEMTIEQVKEKYFPVERTEEEYTRNHLLTLAESEKSRHDFYATASLTYKENSSKRILRYINNRTDAEKRYPEYKVFIEAMEKSLALCN